MGIVDRKHTYRIRKVFKKVFAINNINMLIPWSGQDKTQMKKVAEDLFIKFKPVYPHWNLGMIRYSMQKYLSDTKKLIGKKANNYKPQFHLDRPRKKARPIKYATVDHIQGFPEEDDDNSNNDSSESRRGGPVKPKDRNNGINGSAKGKERARDSSIEESSGSPERELTVAEEVEFQVAIASVSPKSPAPSFNRRPEKNTVIDKKGASLEKHSNPVSSGTRSGKRNGGSTGAQSQAGRGTGIKETSPDSTSQNIATQREAPSTPSEGAVGPMTTQPPVSSNDSTSRLGNMGPPVLPVARVKVESSVIGHGKNATSQNSGTRSQTARPGRKSPTASIRVDFVEDMDSDDAISSFTLVLYKRHTLRTFLLSVEKNIGSRIDPADGFLLYFPLRDATDGSKWSCLRDVQSIIRMFIEHKGGVYMTHCSLVRATLCYIYFVAYSHG